MSEMMMMKTTNSSQESTESDSSRMTTITNSSQESTESDSSRMTTMTNSSKESTDSDSSRRNSTSSSSDLSDGSHGSSGSPAFKRPRLATVTEAMSDDLIEFMELIDFTEVPAAKDDGPSQIEMSAKLVLDYYKKKEGKDFEISRLRSLTPFPHRRQGIAQDGTPRESSGPGTHLNFFARPTGTTDGPEYLFYGELVHRPVLFQVVSCYVFPLGTDDGVDLIKHPPNVFCPDCDYLGLYVVDDEDFD